MPSDEIQALRSEVERLRAELARVEARERATAEEQRTTELRFRELIRDLEVGVVVQGPAAEVLVANRAALELLGLTEDQFLGRTSYDPDWNIVREDGTPYAAADRPVASVLATASPVRNAVLGISRPRKQDRVWLLANAIPELDEAGRVKRVVITLGDLTERKRLEASLATAQRLEGLGRLAGGIAHDFNNLLTVMTAYCELAQAAMPAAARGRIELAHALEAAESAAALTAQLLTFARRQVVAPRLVDVAEVLRNATGLLSRLIGSHIELQTTIDPRTGVVRIDPSQLEQIFMNLAINARDAMPDGGTLAIEVAPTVVDQRSFVVISVRDDGVGMDAATQARAFEPFFTTKEAGRGTGLGLATVQAIVAQLGGSITLESQRGVGTRFQVLLPSAVGLPSELPAPPPGLPPAHGETLLIADDEPRLRSLAHRILSEAGYRVLVAQNGLEAIEVAAAHEGPIDLLVTDLVMAKMGGRRLAETLVRDRPSLRVLFVSGYADDPPESGAFLAKPYDVDGLLAAVRAALA